MRRAAESSRAGILRPSTRKRRSATQCAYFGRSGISVLARPRPLRTSVTGPHAHRQAVRHATGIGHGVEIIEASSIYAVELRRGSFAVKRVDAAGAAEPVP